MRRTILLMATTALTLLVASGVALAVTRIGTDGPDTLKGTNGADTLFGKNGNDRIFGLRGNDSLLGGAGKDVVFGGKVVNGKLLVRVGDKNLVGGPGNDWVLGGLGADNVVGGEGNDLVADGILQEFSRDTLSSGDGNDVILVDNKPATRDLVVCGSGFDRVQADRADQLAPDCEFAVVVHGSYEDIVQQEERFFESIPESFFDGLPPL